MKNPILKINKSTNNYFGTFKAIYNVNVFNTGFGVTVATSLSTFLNYTSVSTMLVDSSALIHIENNTVVPKEPEIF